MRDNMDRVPKAARPDYSRRRKQFVEVIAEHKVDGSTVPKTILLANGRRFEVELERDPFPTEDESRTPRTTYPIRSNGERTFLFEDGGRWYVLMKI